MTHRTLSLGERTTRRCWMAISSVLAIGCVFQSTPPPTPVHRHQYFLSDYATHFDARVRIPPSQSCPRRRAGVACDERTTVAVANSCSAPKVRVRAFAGAVGIESGAINLSKVLHSRRLHGDSHWRVSATSGLPNESRLPGSTPLRQQRKVDGLPLAVLPAIPLAAAMLS